MAQQEASSTAPATSRPIFVTGAPRSGTSWLGQMLAGATGGRYVYEPFNPQWNPALKGKLQHFEYMPPGAGASAELQRCATRAFAGKQSVKQLGRALYRGYWRQSMVASGPVVVKDPTAVLLSGWLAGRHNTDTLVIVRHPCGFASSIMALGWELSLYRFFEQQALMDDYLTDYAELLVQAQADPWLRVGAFWGAVHTVVLDQLADNGTGLVCRYEELCTNPRHQLSTIAAALGLELQAGELPAQSATSNDDPGSIYRDSDRMAGIWKERLSAQQIDAVLGIVAEFGLGKYAADPA